MNIQTKKNQDDERIHANFGDAQQKQAVIEKPTIRQRVRRFFTQGSKVVGCDTTDKKIITEKFAFKSGGYGGFGGCGDSCDYGGDRDSSDYGGC